MELPGLDTGEVERGPTRSGAPRPSIRGPGPRGRGRTGRPARAGASRRGPAGAPRSVPVTTTPRPLTAKTRSIARREPVAGRPRALGGARRVPQLREGVAKRRRSLRRSAEETASDRRAGQRRLRQQPADRRDHLGRPLGTGHVDLGHDGDAGRDPERVEQREVLDASGRAGRRRRPRPAARHRSRPPRRACCRPAGRALGHPRSRARRHSAASGAHSRRRSSSRGAAPRAAGPRRCRSGHAGASVFPWSMWPAVPMTTVIPRSPPRDRVAPGHARAPHRAPHRPPGRSSAGRAARPRPGPAPTTAGSPVRSRRASASGRTAAHDQPDRLERLARQRPAPDRRSHLGHRDPGPGRRRQGRQRAHRPAAPSAAGVAAIIRQTGISVVGPAGPIEPQGRGQRGQDHLLGPDRAGERVLPDPGDEVGAPDDEPGLRPADQLVAAERDEVGAGRQPLARGSARGPARRPPSRATPRFRGRR